MNFLSLDERDDAPVAPVNTRVSIASKTCPAIFSDDPFGELNRQLIVTSLDDH